MRALTHAHTHKQFTTNIDVSVYPLLVLVDIRSNIGEVAPTCMTLLKHEIKAGARTRVSDKTCIKEHAVGISTNIVMGCVTISANR